MKRNVMIVISILIMSISLFGCSIKNETVGNRKKIVGEIIEITRDDTGITEVLIQKDNGEKSGILINDKTSVIWNDHAQKANVLSLDMSVIVEVDSKVCREEKDINHGTVKCYKASEIIIDEKSGFPSERLY